MTTPPAHILNPVTRRWLNAAMALAVAGTGDTITIDKRKHGDHLVAMGRAAIAFDDLATAVATDNHPEVERLLTLYGYRKEPPHEG